MRGGERSDSVCMGFIMVVRFSFFFIIVSVFNMMLGCVCMIVLFVFYMMKLIYF